MESDSESDASIGTTVARSGSATEQVSDHSTLADTESVTTDSSTPSTSSAKTLLSSLRQPAPSKLARIRKVQCNPPTGKKRSAAGRSAFAPATIRPIDRVKQYPNEQFIVSANKFFCAACKEEISTKKSVIDMHIKSSKHTSGKLKLLEKKKTEMTISEALKSYDSTHHAVGESLPESTRIFRVKVVHAFLSAGIPLQKIDKMRDLLEENGHSLSSSTHLRQLVPFIHNNEMSMVQKEISGRHVSFIFDGTTHVAEAFVMILHYVDDQWCIQQRVVSLMLLAKSLAGEEVARLLIETLSTKLGIASANVIAATRDRASVNSVAMRTIKVVYPKIFDVGCYSHTLDHVGEKMDTLILNEFIKGWISLFAHSPKTRLAWSSLTGLPPPTYSAVRWWSKYEVIKQVHDAFGDVSSFLRSDSLPSISAGKLRGILDDPAKCRKLKIELAITVDAMTPFVSSTYLLEGDGPLIFIAYREISKLHAAISCGHYPNVSAVAICEARGNTVHETQLLTYAKNCVEPAYAYFRSKFDINTGDLKYTLQAFKAARYCDPTQLNVIKPTPTDIDSLIGFDFIDSQCILKLKDELPAYLAASEDVSTEIKINGWWKSHNNELPNWTAIYKLFLLVQPSSAAAERVFSVLQSTFSTKQNVSLEDYICTSVMLQCNHK